MKHFLNICLLVFMFIFGIFFTLSDPVEIGTVVGKPTVQHDVTYERYSGRYTVVSYKYKDKNGIVYEDDKQFNSKSDFNSSRTAQFIVQKGKVYGETWYTILGKTFYWLAWAGLLVFTIYTWACYQENYYYYTPREKFKCDDCPCSNICYFMNSSVKSTNESLGKSLKGFFGL